MLVAVISVYEEGSARMTELNVDAAEFATMRRVCLLYLADHGDVDAIRHDVVAPPPHRRLAVGGDQGVT